MQTTEIFSILISIMKRVFNDDELRVSMDLTYEDVDEWSSLTQAILITEIENAFDIKFKLKEVVTMNNVQTIITLIQSKIE